MSCRFVHPTNQPNEPHGQQVREESGDFKARSLAKIDAAMRYASEEAHWIQEEAQKLQKEAYRFAHNKPPRCVCV